MSTSYDDNRYATNASMNVFNLKEIRKFTNLLPPPPFKIVFCGMDSTVEIRDFDWSPFDLIVSDRT